VTDDAGEIGKRRARRWRRSSRRRRTRGDGCFTGAGSRPDRGKAARAWLPVAPPPALDRAHAAVANATAAPGSDPTATGTQSAHAVLEPHQVVGLAVGDPNLAVAQRDQERQQFGWLGRLQVVRPVERLTFGGQAEAAAGQCPGPARWGRPQPARQEAASRSGKDRCRHGGKVSAALPPGSGGRGCRLQVTTKSRWLNARPAARVAICTGAGPALPLAS